MKYCVGIDLGSTTTKAVILGEEGEIRGRGITNSRSNYKVACDVAVGEALIDARFGLIAERLDRAGMSDAERDTYLERLEDRFREQQYKVQLGRFRERVAGLPDFRKDATLAAPFEAIMDVVDGEASDLFAPGATRRSDFFRDLLASRYHPIAEEVARERGADFNRLLGLFDKAILQVENLPPDADQFGHHANVAVEAMDAPPAALADAVRTAAAVELECLNSVGTGYGRATLPFEKDQIRSEILCHGLGAHAMFPDTRTVLDIGGQDTKAIQVDEAGIVTSFQMNDRCAAGCGRYLGYIADEMNLGVQELGPLASQSTRKVRINSTCTVFAGAELRERLSLGENREDILAGLHRSIILRAMSLLARSGGVDSEFTFTGGVAKNEAAVSALQSLIEANYGEMKINISPDSIYTGALGAALFAKREWSRRLASAPESEEVVQ
ncbi:acyl-CoA dehydratase activase [bacterium]|nr:acyl-CoA dehydratase activase [bacterium]